MKKVTNQKITKPVLDVKETEQEIPVETENQVKETIFTRAKRNRTNFKQGDLIPCRCVRPNKVVYYSTKTDTRYEWLGYGDIVDVDFADLSAFKSSKSAMLYEPKIVIEDEELYEEWKHVLEPVYKEYLGIEDAVEIFSIPDSSFEHYLRTFPAPFKDIVKVTAMRMIKDGEFDSISKIRIMDDVLGTCMKDFI